jgi:hypothetical protein
MEEPMIDRSYFVRAFNDLNDALLRYNQELPEYLQKIQDEFQTEWSKKKFKWFFKKYRQRKLKSKIYRRHCKPIFGLIEDVVEDTLPKAMEFSFDQFVDVKDLALGDKNYFMDEHIEKCRQDIINVGGCPSSVLNGKENVK